MSPTNLVRPKKRSINLLTKIKKRSGLDGCMFCNDNSTDELFCGEIKFHRRSSLRVHYFCMLFSKGLTKQEEDETVGICGFKPAHILNEIKRGEKHLCSFCNKYGATMRCDEKSCSVNFHMPCGRRNDVQFFSMYCANHAPKKIARVPNPKRVGTFFGTGRVMCTICKFYVPSRSSRTVISSSCCKLAYFHWDCVQNQAVNAGEYHFRCPNCNDQDKYRQDVLKFGVYIPIRDASWETDGLNRFANMYQRPGDCSTRRCCCPIGRHYSKPNDPKFSFVYCDQCGSRAAHVSCSQFEMALGDADWLCSDCVPPIGLPSLHITKPGSEPCSSSSLTRRYSTPIVLVSLNAVTCESNSKNDESDSSVRELISTSSSKTTIVRRTHRMIMSNKYSSESELSDDDLYKNRKRKKTSPKSSPDLSRVSDTDTDSQAKRSESDLKGTNLNLVLHESESNDGDDCMVLDDGGGDHQQALLPATRRNDSSSSSSSSSFDTSSCSDSDLYQNANDEDDEVVLID